MKQMKLLLLLKRKTTGTQAAGDYSADGAAADAADVDEAEDGCCGEQRWMPAAADVADVVVVAADVVME